MLGLKSHKSFLLAALVLCLAAPHAHAKKEGAGSTGGGEGLVFADGSVRFLDMVMDQELPRSERELMSKAQIQEQFVLSKRYVKKLGSRQKDFFRCAEDKLIISPIRALSQLARMLPEVSVFSLEIRLYSTKDETFALDKNAFIPVVATSSRRVPQAWQEPLATFYNGQLWLSGRLVKSLSVEDRCALAIHEALRLLNFQSPESFELSTDEIELLTRELMRDNLSLELSVVEKLQKLDLSEHETLLHNLVAIRSEEKLAKRIGFLTTELEGRDWIDLKTLTKVWRLF